MKKVLSVFIALVLLFAINNIAYAAPYIVKSGSCGSNATWSFRSDGLLTISGTGKVDDYDFFNPRNNPPWEDVRKEIKEIVISYGITNVGNAAFHDCRKLTSVIIPDSVTVIGDHAFYFCDGLTSISLPKGLTQICKSAFSCCSELVSITIPEGVTSIGDYAFSTCWEMSSATLPNSLKHIGEGAFAAAGLKSIAIPDGITVIEKDTFRDCTELSSITIPYSVTSIGSEAFKRCLALTSFEIPYSVTNIGEQAFMACTHLASVTLPPNITVIAPETFSNCLCLSSITIPEGVTRIGEDSFYYCRDLKTVTIPKSVTTIGNGAFNKTNYYKDYPIDTVNYSGKPADRDRMIIGSENDILLKAKWNYNYVIPTPEIPPDPAALKKIAAFVTRCYQVILSREPDGAGLEDWTNALANGTRKASEIIDGFVNSNEFLNKHLSNGDAVEILYKAMLGRGSDPAGKASWVSYLNVGNPFGVVINGFCGSDEFNALCREYGIEPGSVNVGPVIDPSTAPVVDMEKIRAFVTRCYSVILSRDPDGAGLDDWSNALATGKRKASEIIDGFVNSNEFLGKHLSNEDAVEILYKAMLGRGSDPVGKAEWVAVLNAGKPFGAVINGFCGSQEFTSLCAEYGIQPGSVKVAGAVFKADIPEGMMTDDGGLGDSAPEEAKEEAPAPAPIIAESMDGPEGVSMTGEVYTAQINEEKVRAFVIRCYSAALGRNPDEANLANYVSQIVEGISTPKAVIRDFMLSDEFKAKGLGAEETVKILYRVCMNRGADPEGLALWTEKMNNGTSLEDLLKEFTSSDEFKKMTDSLKE